MEWNIEYICKRAPTRQFEKRPTTQVQKGVKIGTYLMREERAIKYSTIKTSKSTTVATKEKLKMLPTMVINTSSIHSSLSQPKKLCLRNTD